MATLSLNSQQDMEKIARLDFKNVDVLLTKREKVIRHANLLKAVVLDSLHNAEVVITVEDKESLKKLRARIIATGDERVMLDKGISIPLQCIRHVEFP